MYDWDVSRNGRVAWVAKTDDNAGTISTIRKVMDKNSPLMTSYSYVQKGELFNVNPLSHYKAKPENYVPLKANLDVTKYGGYQSIKPAYLVFIEYGPDKKRKRMFEVIHGINANKIHTDEDLKKYFEDLGYENIRLLSSRIKKGALINA